MKIIMMLFFTSVIVKCVGQNGQENNSDDVKKSQIQFINNKDLKYKIIILACDTCAPISNIGYRVLVVLSNNERKLVKKIKYDEWNLLLNSEKSDWAANLVLYNLFDKDAFLLARNPSRNLWVKYLKKDDIEFWHKKFLKQNQ
jgi:hypothetical protein